MSTPQQNKAQQKLNEEQAKSSQNINETGVKNSGKKDQVRESSHEKVKTQNQQNQNQIPNQEVVLTYKDQELQNDNQEAIDAGGEEHNLQIQKLRTAKIEYLKEVKRLGSFEEWQEKRSKFLLFARVSARKYLSKRFLRGQNISKTNQ